jgi:hypothetical protein
MTKGDIIKIKGCKRVHLIVQSVADDYWNTNIKCGRIYKPSPKSRLRKANPFRRKSVPLLLK